MKKMTLTKAKWYAQKIMDIEQKIQKATDKKERQNYELEIVAIVDEVCEGYEPTAMYKIDEQVYALAKKK